jgi:hypothetical protein
LLRSPTTNDLQALVPVPLTFPFLGKSRPDLARIERLETQNNVPLTQSR